MTRKLDDYPTTVLYCRAPIGPAWARQVRRHQRRLAQRLAAGTRAEEPTPPRPDAGLLPWTIADLRRPHRLHYTSDYIGVTLCSRQTRNKPWTAYRPANARVGRKQIGHFATQEQAAGAVLKAINPDAVLEPTGETL